ncbi:MAG: hypothetical protein LUI87_02360 [Lachnospiraceae bacterium]|nr:hypothetical protein [Lachnospiraceae bacterium]
MTLQDIAGIIAPASGWVVVILLIGSRLIKISQLEINPWKAIGKAIGKAINGDVMTELEAVKKSQADIAKRLDEREKIEDARNADMHRTRILQYNLELIRNLKHTKEDFDDILAEVDAYRKYCSGHPDYPNKRAEHAIKNIERVYDERVRKRDFSVAEEGDENQ